MENRNGTEDLSLDNLTFDQNIDATRAPASSGTTTSSGASATISTQSSSVHGNGIAQRVVTAKGDEILSSSFGPNAMFIGKQQRCRVLPVPNLPGYENLPPATKKIGKFVKFSQFKDYEARLQTFTDWHWPLQKPSAESLAKADMFFSGSFEDKGEKIRGQATCYKCGGTLRKWEEEDDPKTEHRKLYPRCFEENWLLDMA